MPWTGACGGSHRRLSRQAKSLRAESSCETVATRRNWSIFLQACIVSALELTESFLAKIAGWEAVKQARALLAQGKVLSSNWTPPLLKGVVEEGSSSYRAGLVLKDTINIENLCSCRASRQWGTICAHSVAVGLHHLSGATPVSAASAASKSPYSAGSSSASGSQRSVPKSGKRLQRSTKPAPGFLRRTRYAAHLAFKPRKKCDQQVGLAHRIGAQDNRFRLLQRHGRPAGNL